jgi:chloride channel protein, CIC family
VIKLPILHVVKLLLGGLGVALCGLAFATRFGGLLLPLGPNYQVARNLLANPYPSAIVLLFFATNAVAALLTLGSGGVGAMFVPLLLLGEALGRCSADPSSMLMQSICIARLEWPHLSRRGT